MHRAITAALVINLMAVPRFATAQQRLQERAFDRSIKESRDHSNETPGTVAACISDHCQPYGSSRTENITVTPGSESFEVDGIPCSRGTEWYVNNSYQSPTHCSGSGLSCCYGLCPGDPGFTYSFGCGATTQIKALVYYAPGCPGGTTWNLEETHIWNVSAPETFANNPSTPSGPGSGLTGQNLNYSTGGASTSCGHSLQYRFDWGDGTTSSWGGTGASHSWSNPGTYCVKAQARCATHTTILSSSSSCRNVVLSPPPFEPYFWNARISNRVDEDGDGYARQFNIEFDVDSNVGGFYYVKIYEDDALSDDYLVTSETFWVQGTPEDYHPVNIVCDNHNLFHGPAEFLLKLYDASNNSLVEEWDQGDDSDLGNVLVELSSEDIGNIRPDAPSYRTTARYFQILWMTS